MRATSITNIGKVVYARLAETMGEKATAIFPVITDSADLPYICYRRSATTEKYGMGCFPAETVQVEVVAYAKTYAESVSLAEDVREAMEQQQWPGVRRCLVADAYEDYDVAGNAYSQTLIFDIATT